MSGLSRVRRILSNGSRVDQLLRRIGCQLDFAKAIDDGSFSNLIGQAEAHVLSAQGSERDLAAAVQEAEDILAPLVPMARSFTIHLIGHGHIDMNWMWSWPETCAATHDTFASVLNLMEQYPELTYTQSQASVYALVEKYHPAMFEKIRQRVQEGRWEVAAAQWVEGDKNLASGESLAHHLLYTRRWVQEKFGLSPEDVTLNWEPDTFGHCNTLPGILRQGGVKYYYCCRPGGGQEHARVGDERPPVFWWEGPDGSRLLVCKEITWYNSYVEIGENFALPAVRFWRETGLRDWMNVYGIGNHGGGPTRAEIDYFLETRDWPCWPNIIFGTAQKWFEKVEPQCADSPVLDHELNYEFTGCYSSQSAIKRANRYGENYCLEAEILNALVPGEASQENLREAWINVLFNQFHDILPGSGVAATRDHALGLFQEVGAITGAVKRNALNRLGDSIDTASLLPAIPDAEDEAAILSSPETNPISQAGAGQGAWDSGFSRASGGGKRFRPIMIFNPCAWERTETVQVSLYDLETDIPNDRIVALDHAGVAHPTLNVTGAIGGTHDWGHRRTDLLFEAKDVPPLGYKVFLLCEGSASPHEGVVALTETEFQTPAWNIALSKYRSGVETAVAADGSEFCSGCEPLGQWESVREKPKGMSAWLLSNEESIPLEASGPSFRVVGARRNEATSLMSGSSSHMVARQKLRVPNTKSTVDLTTVIGNQHARIDWFAQIDWREIGDSEAGIPGLRIDFELPATFVSQKHVLFETAFGTVLRPAWGGEEVPSLRFAHVASPDGSQAITLLQDSKYSHSTDYSTLSLRVLRSTYEPDHAPEVARSSMRYAVVFHDRQPHTAELVQLGAAFNHPLLIVPLPLQHGDRPVHRSFASVETRGVVLSTLKAAEDGSGLVIRLVNYTDAEVVARVLLDSELLAGKSRATPCDLMERPASGYASLTEDALEVKITANSFSSALIQ